jgi:hypothetical protein
MILLVLQTVVIVAILTQFVWMIRQNYLFKRYQNMWEVAHKQWNAAERQWQTSNYQNDEVGMKAAFEKEQQAFRAEEIAFMLPPWRWIKRWNYDYLNEG